MTEDCKIRFANNNFLATGATITSSTFDASFPRSNIFDQRRGLVGKFRGNFRASAFTIYINDGADKSVNIAATEYTGATLAVEIASKLNSVSSSWTCTYSTSTYKFTINRTSGTKILRFTQASNAIWNFIGFTAAVDSPSGPWVGDESRIHSEEWIKIDLGVNQRIGMVGLVAPIGAAFGLSPNAVLKIQGNNFDNWDFPNINQTMEHGFFGAFAYPDEYQRFWRISIRDQQNASGPSALSIGFASISTTVLMTRSINQGFSTGFVDPTFEITSESGAKYFDTRQKYWTFSGDIQAAFGESRRELEQFFYDYGVSQPFFISFDPKLKIFENQGEVSKLVRFSSMPGLQNIVRDYFNISLSLAEVV